MPQQGKRNLALPPGWRKLMMRLQVDSWRFYFQISRWLKYESRLHVCISSRTALHQRYGVSYNTMPSLSISWIFANSRKMRSGKKHKTWDLRGESRLSYAQMAWGKSRRPQDKLSFADLRKGSTWTHSVFRTAGSLPHPRSEFIVVFIRGYCQLVLMIRTSNQLSNDGFQKLIIEYPSWCDW